MKNSAIRFPVIGFLLIGLSFAVAGQTKKPETKIIEPTAKEAIKQIFLNGDIRLAEAQYCKGEGMEFSDKTIFDFLSGVLAIQAEPETHNNIEFTFKQEKNKFNELFWVCDVWFLGGDKDDIWSYGVRFKMRNSDRKMLRESLTCISSG